MFPSPCHQAVGAFHSYPPTSLSLPYHLYSTASFRSLTYPLPRTISYTASHHRPFLCTIAQSVTRRSHPYPPFCLSHSLPQTASTPFHAHFRTLASTPCHAHLRQRSVTLTSAHSRPRLSRALVPSPRHLPRAH
jgi:hypothetical protein